MGSKASPRNLVNESVYVAVGRDVEESKSTLLWALENFDGEFRIIHVHQPRINPSVGRGNDDEVRAWNEYEWQKMQEILDIYIHICTEAKVNAKKRYNEIKDVGKGIVDLIEQHNIVKLVMGAAANIRYVEGMTELKSSKAIFVNEHASPTCQIWFISDGHLIQRREASLNAVDMDFTPSSPVAYSTTESTPRSPQSSVNSRFHPGEVANNLDMVSYERGEASSSKSEPISSPPFEQGYRKYTEIYGEFERVMEQAETARRDAFQGLMKRLKASEKKAAEAIRMGRAFQISCEEEARRRKEMEESFAKEKQGFEDRIKQQEQELHIARDQQISLENRNADLELIIKDLNDKIASTEEQLQNYKKERDCLQLEHDKAVRLKEELLRNQSKGASTSRGEQNLSEFSFSEIQRETRNFEPSMKIAEYGYGSIYKASLHHTEVAIKLLQTESARGLSLFEHELEFMSKLRHPNIVSLIGICPDRPYALIYEHLHNGSLEDRLSCKDDTPALSWQTRVQIATEICGALIFVHSNRPQNFVHGNLKPANILLDTNFVAKLSDFGTLIVRPGHISSRDAADFPHLDPHFLTTGELSAESDVYSFGIVLLQLLTGRSALNLLRDMQDAVNGGNTSYITALLDPLAGEWPNDLAMELAELALECCEIDPSQRPDLGSDVWNVLDEMRAFSLQVPTSDQPGSQESCQPPDYFLCPILQDVMKDPQVAADGFTYEAEALKQWLNSGRNTSPMTNLPLSHFNLTPNLTLRSGIQQWLEKQ